MMCEHCRKNYFMSERNQPFLIAIVIGVALTMEFTSSCGGRSVQQQGVNSVGEVAANESRSIDACSLLTAKEIVDVVGNAVAEGRPFAGPEVCKWGTEDPTNVDVLLTVRAAGSIREQTLCADLRKPSNNAQRVDSLGDVSVWKFSREGPMFNSGDLEVCGQKGYLNLTLQGKRDEPTLKSAATLLAQKVLERL